MAQYVAQLGHCAMMCTLLLCFVGQVALATKIETTLTKQDDETASRDYFVSPEFGDDKNNDGLSQHKPLKTLQKAESKTTPGDTVYLMNGVHRNVGFGTGKTKNLSPVLVYVGVIFVCLSLKLLCSLCLVSVVTWLHASML